MQLMQILTEGFNFLCPVSIYHKETEAFVLYYVYFSILFYLQSLAWCVAILWCF